jgi:hypothetical protein
VTDSTNNIIGWVTAASTIVIAAVICIYAYLTNKLIRTTKRIAEEQSRPYVVVTLPSRNRKLDLSIKNYGQRPAKQVEVDFDPDLRTIAFQNVGEMTFRPLLTQEFLAPGQEVLGLVALTPEIVRSEVEGRFTVTVDYSDQNGTKYHETSVINISNYVWDKSLVRKNSQDYLANIAIALAEIRDILTSQHEE